MSIEKNGCHLLKNFFSGTSQQMVKKFGFLAVLSGNAGAAAPHYKSCCVRSESLTNISYFEVKRKKWLPFYLSAANGQNVCRVVSA
ncbi:MAG: hypothetical protein LBT53_04975 [Puniceicoccales bacterium]|jgi:hypothetical protein|nr:hypothetical protein [Puniceicoccales bacterium]